MRVAVVGAGPSGLVTLKYLVTAHKFLGTEPIEARLFESEGEVGGTFVARVYEDAELVSSKQLTTFSDWRPREDDPDFLSAGRYVGYLKDYCTHFNLWPHINLSTKVVSVSRRTGGGHTVVYEKDGLEDSWECDAIAVCSGLHVVPNIPEIPGIENVPVTFHSSQFKKREDFGVDKTVLVLGSGETGADLAYLAVTSPTKQVVLCHRKGFHFAPKRNPTPIILPILGRKPKPRKTLPVPVDSSRASLFDTAYIHPWLRKTDLLWKYYNWYVRAILWTTTGTTHGLDQWVGGITPGLEDSDKIFFNKSNKAGPYVSAPYRPKQKSLLETLRSAIIAIPPVDTHGRQIDLAPFPERIDATGTVHFRNNGRPEYERMKDSNIKPDIVVFCTGYKQVFPFLNNSSADKSAKPYPTAAEADVRDIWARDDPTVAFVGFVRPSLGAIPPLSELQAQLWVLSLVSPGRVPRPLAPEDERHYRLLHPPESRVQYGVDHESYAYQLALDMDAAPGALEVVGLGLVAGGNRVWRLPLVWALGANFNAKFRLRGPWRWEGAVDVLGDELWETVARRGWFFGHFSLSALPMMIFGPISLMFWIYATIWELLMGVVEPPKMKAVKVVNGVNGVHHD
ncbi:FAD/NAD(P)-binding domain-containing protein [Coniochaeta ligniaria NRRL 30616]|uniref:FAD/NAD(P)-binding domain-containing protein n=1 Tax=Coniochaeta ligniaria NRRL 30616 TaxID=1408157 RepID=A0A1J7JIT1_9PEZI|nr:FAD/NAD(P)-binding domain-containing protein [Coniochaeta ligniaria NRRL 30616]